MPGKRVSFNIVQMVYYNYYDGKTISELSEMFCLSRQTIYNIIKRAEDEGRLQPNEVTGRPRKLSDRNIRSLLRKVDENPRISIRTLAHELKEESGVTVSHETMRQVLKKK
ncbi:uncharacterized protein LOC119682687 [Teleopsis dalmanni]|uniref:uncharacterized protein LOC119682687 n=1 Tax=Teleopsis dalmanni TaxID=139649 RepID=UPI0018CD53B2|nr:uncharacterized protein LOC119682687 [Teleopsis dalmanni]